MTNLANTKENNNLIKALKSVNSCKWAGSTSFDDIDRCLRSIGLQTLDSGNYTMTPIKLKGMTGIYLVNEDGSLNYEFRILNEDTKFTIESLSMSGYNDFEAAYRAL
tara:strand:+ start:58 stop:378 length:321 start_codon:yes stop_codon:yes gene_type:complete